MTANLFRLQRLEICWRAVEKVMKWDVFTGVELVGRSARPIVATVCSVAHVSGMALITCVTYIATNPTDIELFAAVCTSTQLVVLW